MNRFAIAAAAVAACALPLTASAAADAHASIDSLGITLVDLDPADGIAPSITFQPSFNGFASAAVASASDNALGSQSEQRQNRQAFADVGARAGVGGAAGRASMSGSLWNGSLRLAADGSGAGASELGGGTLFDAGAYGAGGRFELLGFTLSPHTRVLFSGSADLFARTTVGTQQDTSGAEVAHAEVVLSIFGSGFGQGDQSSIVRYQADASTAFTFDPVSGTTTASGQTVRFDDVPLAVSFTNGSGDLFVGAMNLTAQVSGQSYVTAVPEPDAVALLLAGLAVLGFAARRREAGGR